MEAERQGLAHPEVFPDASASAAANGSVKLLAGPAAAAAAAYADSSSSLKEPLLKKKKEEEPLGQEIDLPFMAWMREGTYNLQLVLMSDCWVGVDEVVPVSWRLKNGSHGVHPGDAKGFRASRDSRVSVSKVLAACSRECVLAVIQERGPLCDLLGVGCCECVGVKDRAMSKGREWVKLTCPLVVSHWCLHTCMCCPVSCPMHRSR
jgi:hypothetical protein